MCKRWFSNLNRNSLREAIKTSLYGGTKPTIHKLCLIHLNFILSFEKYENVIILPIMRCSSKLII